METLVHVEPGAVAWMQSYCSAVLLVSWAYRWEDVDVGTHDPRVKADQSQYQWNHSCTRNLV